MQVIVRVKPINDRERALGESWGTAQTLCVINLACPTILRMFADSHGYPLGRGNTWMRLSDMPALPLSRGPQVCAAEQRAEPEGVDQ